MLYLILCKVTFAAFTFLTSLSYGSTYYVQNAPSSNYQCPESTATCHIYCDVASHSNYNTYDCNDAENCYFHCNALSCGAHAVINAAYANNLQITQSSEGELCLQSAQINTPNEGSAYLHSSSKKGFSFMTLTAGTNANEIIIDASKAIAATAGDYYGMKIYASTATYFYMKLGDVEWSHGVLQCPINPTYAGPATAPCVIDASEATMTEITIEAPGGIPKNVWIDGCGSCTNVQIQCAQSGNEELYPYVMDTSYYPFITASECWRTRLPTTDPTAKPTPRPTTLSPTKRPTPKPTAAPTVPPTFAPTASPIPSPTAATQSPSAAPTFNPTASTLAPTNAPTYSPTVSPTMAPSEPTLAPTAAPDDKASMALFAEWNFVTILVVSFISVIVVTVVVFVWFKGKKYILEKEASHIVDGISNESESIAPVILQQIQHHNMSNDDIFPMSQENIMEMLRESDSEEEDEEKSPNRLKGIVMSLEKKLSRIGLADEEEKEKEEEKAEHLPNDYDNDRQVTAGGIDNTAAEAEKVERWMMNVVELPEYTDVLINNGFDTIDSCMMMWKLGMDELMKLGVKVGHARKLVKYSRALYERNDMFAF